MELLAEHPQARSYFLFSILLDLISGIGENKLRELMDSGEIEYVQNGNRRLLAEAAIWDWYERHKIAIRAACPVVA